MLTTNGRFTTIKISQKKDTMSNKTPKNASTTKSFIQAAKEKHGNKYNYDRVDYVHSKSKIVVTCSKHGDFKQSPNHLLRGTGCPKCAGNEKLTTSEFIEKAKKLHHNKYNYDTVDYVNAKTKVKIVCNLHGEFEQLALNHLSNHGCPKCGVRKKHV